MGQYKVLSPLKSGGKLRAIDDVVELDDAVAAKLRPGIVEAVAAKKESAKAPPAPVLAPAASVVAPVVEVPAKPAAKAGKKK